MATATSSPFLAPLRFSTQIPGSHITSAPGSSPVLRIRCWRPFAASHCDVSLVPARFPRTLPRRRNALRDKASQLWPPPAVPHQVRHPYDEAPKLESLDRQEPKSGCLDAEPSSYLKEKLEISGCLGASRSGNVASESELDGEKDAAGVAEEEITFCRTGAGPVFSVYEGPDGNVVRIEVDEDEIIDRSHAAVGEGSDDSESMLSRARVMAMEPKRGKCVTPKNSSLFQFVAANRVESLILNGEVSVAQRNATPLQCVSWSGLTALFSVCLVLALSKLIQTNSKAHLLRRLLYMRRPGMEWVEFDKGNMTMLKKVHGFPGGLQRRPLLDRKELMNNIKQAKESRDWFVLRSSFSCETVSNGDDARITEFRRMVKEVHRPKERNLEQSSTEESNGTIFPHLIVADDEEVSGNQAGVNDVSDGSKLSGYSLSTDKIEETVEQTVDMENGEAVMSTSVKDDDNIGEIELPEPAYNNDMAIGSNDGPSDMNTSEKEAQIGSADYHNLDPNMINTTSCELESEEAFSETCAKNLDIIQGTKPSVPSISYHQIIHSKDNSEFSINVAPERADGLSSDCFDCSASELRNKKTPMDVSVNDINVNQEIEASRASAKDTQTDHYKEFAHNMNMIGEEECKTSIVMDNVTSASSQGSREEPIDLKRDSMQLAQEPKPSISSWNDNQHGETESNGTLNNASTSSLYAPPEETVQHNFSKISTSEKKQEKRTSSNKKFRAHLSKNKVKLQKEVCSSKETETTQSEQGVPGTKAVNGPSNSVQKTKKVAKKLLNKVQSDMQIVTTLEDDQSNGLVDQKNNSQNIKKTRRRYLKNAFSNHEARTRDVNPETTHEVNSPYNAPADIVEPLGVEASSVQTQFSKDAFSKDQPNGSSVSNMRKQDLKLSIRTPERVETAAEETENKVNIDRNKSTTAVTATKKVVKRVAPN
ncbi:hypothetical protein SEVIR_4G125900v4 [Setaria viridis]|uniref:uncharacterized protein isoform X2 n=1 Tax=Setaria viridis TaxID=4556 RepID=UPI003B3BC34D